MANYLNKPESLFSMEDRITNLRCLIRYSGISCKHGKRIDEKAYNKDKKTLMELRQEYLNTVDLGEDSWVRPSFYIVSDKKEWKIRFAESLAIRIEPDIDLFHVVKSYDDLSLYDGESVVIWNYENTNELLNDMRNHDRVYNSFRIQVRNVELSGILNKANIIIGDIDYESFIKKVTEITKNENLSRLSIPFSIIAYENNYDLNVYHKIDKK